MNAFPCLGLALLGPRGGQSGERWAYLVWKSHVFVSVMKTACWDGFVGVVVVVAGSFGMRRYYSLVLLLYETQGGGLR